MPPMIKAEIREPVKTRKKLGQRALPDQATRIRRTVQLLFLALNVWIGVQFFLFVRYYESGGTTLRVERPAGVEGWLPIASLLNLKSMLLTGQVPSIHPAGSFLLIAFLFSSWVFRKSFCGWLCPVGTLSENLWRLGKKIFGRNFRIPRWVDIPLRGLKYLLLGFFLWAVWMMPVEGIRQFLDGPYGIIADVKLMNFFRDLSLTGALVIAVLLIGSIVVQNFWCRYLCPYGALMGLASLVSPLRIRRDESLCIDCAKCAKACPSALPVDRLITIQSAECIGCMECVAICPAEGALYMSLPSRKKRVSAWAIAAGIAIIFFGTYLYARVAGQWDTQLDDSVYHRLVPRASEFGH
jgi:polyferredoxin